DLILHHAHVVTVDARFRTAEALAVKDGRVLAVGDDDEEFALRGPKTRGLDLDRKTVLPRLYERHVHPVSAATSELPGPPPLPDPVEDAVARLKKQVATTPEGDWIVLRYAFPTRLKEARFPTKAELDSVAPRHPVLYHAGPAGLVNSMGLK